MEQASRSIGQSLQAMTRVCFTKDQPTGMSEKPDEYLDKLKEQMDDLIDEYKQGDDGEE